MNTLVTYHILFSSCKRENMTSNLSIYKYHVEEEMLLCAEQTTADANQKGAWNSFCKVHLVHSWYIGLSAIKINHELVIQQSLQFQLHSHFIHTTYTASVT